MPLSSLVEIEETLRAECESVEALEHPRIVECWNAWTAAWPLPEPRFGRSGRADAIFHRLDAVARRRHGRPARRAYAQTGSGEGYVLLVEPLVGWRCRYSTPPNVERFDAEVIVVPTDLSWTFASRDLSWRKTVVCPGPIFVSASALE